jgi:hypothetical protein
MRIELPFFPHEFLGYPQSQPGSSHPFVEKKARGSASRFLRSIPEPLSATLILAAFWPDGCKLTSRRGRIRWPPPRMASKAFANEMEQHLAKFSLEEEECGCGTVAETGAVCRAK